MRLVQSVQQDRRVGLTGRGGRAEGKGGRAEDPIDERAEGPSPKGSLGTQGQRISGISPAPQTRPTWVLASGGPTAQAAAASRALQGSRCRRGQAAAPLLSDGVVTPGPPLQCGADGPT